MPTNRLEPKLDALISSYRGRQGHPTQEELESLYTEGCAELLRLEAELLRVKRRATAALADSPHDPGAARIAGLLQDRLDKLNGEVAAVRGLVRLLRTGFDWTQATAESARTLLQPLARGSQSP
jgi:hypothetical protein